VTQELQSFMWNSAELQKMVTLRLYNDIALNALGLEWILTWQNLKQTAKYSGWTNLQEHCPYVPRKSEREREENKKKDKRYQHPWIQWQILVIGVLRWWVHTPACNCIRYLYTQVTRSSP